MRSALGYLCFLIGLVFCGLGCNVHYSTVVGYARCGYDDAPSMVRLGRWLDRNDFSVHRLADFRKRFKVAHYRRFSPMLLISR